MVTISYTSSTEMNLEPPMTIVSTYQNSLTSFPYMMALGYYQDMFYASTATALAYYVTMYGGYSNSTRNITYSPIALQPCTAKHFSVIPNIEQKETTWGYTSWRCLPLNQIWEIGGDFELSTVFKRIQVNITCTKS